MTDAFRTFKVSTLVAEQEKKDLILRTEALEARINKIVSRVKVDGMDVLRPLLGLTRNREELELIGNALLRLGPLVESYEELESQKKFIEFFLTKPQQVACLAGEFDDIVPDIMPEPDVS